LQKCSSARGLRFIVIGDDTKQHIGIDGGHLRDRARRQQPHPSAGLDLRRPE